MKRIFAFLAIIIWPLAIWLSASGFQINGVVPGSTASMTPISVGTSTPVAIIGCSTPQPSGVPVLGFSVCASASGCYIAPAPIASPCAAASPAPNASTLVGLPIQVCPVMSTLNAQSFNGNAAILHSEWDAVCSSASKITTNTVP